MTTDGNYWLRRARLGKLDRRRFLGGATVAGAGAAAFGLVGCGGDDNGSKTPTSAATKPAGSPSASASAGTSPSAAAASQAKPGGVLRVSSSNATYDTFDFSRSRFSPIATLVGLTSQRAVHWANFKEGKLGGAFAEKWEQPDAQTVNLTIRGNNFFHDKPPVSGRQTTAEDLKFHIERNRDGKLQDGSDDPNFYRKPYYEAVETVSVTSPTTVQVKFNAPNPLFFNLLAQPYEGIQAPEAVKEFEKDYAHFNEKMIIGTGPYILSEFASEGRLKLKKNEKYSGNTNLAGVYYLPLFTDQATAQSAWEQKQLDAFGPSTTEMLNDLKSRFKDQIQDTPNFSPNPIIGGSYYVGSAPWNNPNLVGAIFRAWDRRQLIQQLHGGRGAMSGSVPPQHGSFALPEKELITFPGYLADRDKEIAEARAMWQAGGGPALGEVTIDIPDIIEGLFGAASIVVAMLNKNLGVTQFKAKVEPYSTITTKVVQQKYGNGNANTWFGYDTDVLDPDPTSFLVANYKSDSPMAVQSFGLKIPELDTILDKLEVELEQENRRSLINDAERLLLKSWGSGRTYMYVQITNTLSWNYYHPAEAAPFSTAHLLTNSWIDSSDPTYQGRPSDSGIL